MRAVVVTEPGGPEVLRLEERPDPVPGAEELLVRVRATALNRADLLQRRGRYPAPPGAPSDILGLEFAGEVIGAGAGADRFKPGARVMGIVGGGAHAEKLVVHQRHCMAVPAALDWPEAAAIPEAFLTAFDALFERGRLLALETVLVHAAASGVGTAAGQIAAHSGARVIGLSRSEKKRERLAALGFDRVLDAGAPDLAALLAGLVPKGFDLVIDFLGASSWALNMEVLATRGRLVLVGTMGGSKAEADLSILMRKRLTVVGTVLRGRSIAEKAALIEAFSQRMLPLFERGRLRPVVDRVFPLERIAEAHEVMERNENFGKIVLTC